MSEPEIFLNSAAKLENFRKGLITALKCITIKHKYKQFHNTVYHDSSANMKMIQSRSKHSNTKSKHESKPNVMVLKQRNSFPRPGMPDRRKINKFQKIGKQQNEPSKIKQKSKQRLLLCISKISSYQKLPKVSCNNSYAIDKFCQNNQPSLSIHSCSNNEVKADKEERVELKMLTKLKSSLKINRKIITQKSDKVVKVKGNRMGQKYKENTFQFSKTMTQNNKEEFESSVWGFLNEKKNKLCRWGEDEEHSANIYDTPNFGN